MKLYRLVASLLLISVPAATAGCAGKPVPAEEPAEVVEQEAAEESIEIEEPEPEMEEVPELVWSHDYEDHVDSIATYGDNLAVGVDFEVHIHDLADGSTVDVLTYDHAPEDLAFSPDGTTLGVGLGHGGVVLSDLAGGSVPEDLGSWFNSRLAFSPDGAHLATGNRDGMVWIWELDGLTEVAELDDPNNDEWLVALDYHPSGDLLAATHFDGTVNIWDVETREVAQSLLSSAAISAKSSFRFSPTGTEMAYAVEHNGEQLIRLVAVADEDLIHDIHVPSDVSDLAFSPDGSLLAVASRDATTIWDVKSGELAHQLDQEIDRFENSPSSLVFTSDGTHLAVASWTAGTIEVWQLPELD